MPPDRWRERVALHFGSLTSDSTTRRRGALIVGTLGLVRDRRLRLESEDPAAHDRREALGGEAKYARLEIVGLEEFVVE